MKLHYLMIMLTGFCLAGSPLQADEAAATAAATAFFEEHPNPIDLEQRADRILFANRKIGLEFHQSEGGFVLRRLYGVEQKQNFLVDNAARKMNDLFEIRMTLDPIHIGRDDSHLTKPSLLGILDEMAGDHFPIGSHAGNVATWRREDKSGQTTLILKMEQIDVRESEGVLDVEVFVTLHTDDPLSHWRISVTNRGDRYGIDRVFFPIVPLAPIDEPVQNVFLFPRERGGYVEDPFNAPKGFGAGLQGSRYYSVHLNMQFQALYNRQNQKGIYLATQDPTPNLVHPQIINTPTEIVWRPGHFPPNHTYAQEDYAVPYDCVLGPFQGDWFDACQIYRAWALQQSWCRKGPLATRADVPQWYKKAPLFFYTTVGDSAEGTHSKEENLRLAADQFIRFLKWADMKLPFQLYAWEQLVPGMTAFERPTNLRRRRSQGRWANLAGHNWYDGNYPKLPALPNLASECNRLREAGGVVIPYTALELFDQGPDENSPYAAEARPHITRDLYGALRVWGGHRTWQPCAWTPWWRNRMTEMCVLLQQRERVGGVYLDVMQGGALPCYWVPHGHPAAGADVTTTGMHELVEQIFDAVKAQDPEAIVTGENSTEGMIDVIDGILQVTLWPENKVNMFATVYQDYILRYGLSLSTGVGYKGSGKNTFKYGDRHPRDHFFIECASAFTEGMQIGMIRLPPRPNSLSFDKPEQKEMIEFLQRVVGYYRQDDTSKFLSVGQLMRPLSFSQPASMPMLKYTEDSLFPALMNGVFRTQDGQLGIFVANASTEYLDFEASFDPVRHGLATDAIVDVDNISWEGQTESIHSGVSGIWTLRGSLPGHGLTMFRIKPAASP